MKNAVFAGSFDPPTMGHLDIISRASRMYDNLHVVVSFNSTKNYMFSVEERKSMIESNINEANVKVVIHDGLIAKYAEDNGCDILVRGLRSLSDFNYEFELAELNKKIAPDVETVFIPCDHRYSVVRSSAVREMIKYGADVADMVPDNVYRKLVEKQKN